MPRTQAIFDTIFHLPLHTDDPLLLAPMPPHLQYETVADGIAEEDILLARKDREKASTETFQSKTKWLWKSMEELHTWLYQEHAAYASKRLKTKEETRKVIDPLALRTY